MVKDPITIDSTASVRDLLELTGRHKISGVPVLDGSDLVGIVTSRDVRFVSNLDMIVADIMTPKDRLVTVKEGTRQEAVRKLLHKHRIEKVLVVNEAFGLVGMMTVKISRKPRTTPTPVKIPTVS